jgi:multidrug efflux system membrane fusion protein
MEQVAENLEKKKQLGRRIRNGVVIAMAIALLLVILDTNRYPRTDDASVRANYILIVAEVSGKLTDLPVKDNTYVKRGDLLFAIDPRPYQYALQQALSDQESLEQQIIDQKRKIASQKSAVVAANAAVYNSTTGVKTAGSGISAAQAATNRAQAAVVAAEAQLKLATNNYHRIEPLLQKQYVTAEQVDQSNTAVRVAQGNYDEAQAALAVAVEQQRQAVLHQASADATAAESAAKLAESIHIVDTLDTLMSQRQARAAKVENASLDLERCRVLAPFDAYVTNMNISVGEYAHPGAPIFTLIDTRKWYVIANYRESKLKNIPVGTHVDVYLLEHPNRRFNGKVESIGYGVFPEDGQVVGGLPNIERTLNWVHLSTRFPVRVLVEDPDPKLFRIGATAVTVVR